MPGPWKLLPGEWVLGTFLLYAVARVLVSGELSLDQRSLPRTDFFAVFLVVLATRLVADYRRTPWRLELGPQRKLHLAFLALFAIALPLVLPRPPHLAPANGWEGASTEIFIGLYDWTQIVLLVVAPVLIFWLVSAAHIKAHGRLDTLGMVRQGWRGALRTLRDWVPVVALIYFYGLMRPVIGRGLFGDQDAALARIDRWMFFGHSPHVLCEAIISRPLSEWLCACYLFYLPLFPIVLGWVFAKRDPAPFRELGFALTLTLAVGYFFYTVVPAQGPLFLDHFDVNLEAYVGQNIKAQLMDRARVPRDCFPSLHTGASLVLLWGAFRHARRLFWAVAPFVVCIPLACVYLRYHYVVDVVAGVALFAGVAWVTTRSRTLQAAFGREGGEASGA